MQRGCCCGWRLQGGHSEVAFFVIFVKHTLFLSLLSSGCRRLVTGVETFSKRALRALLLFVHSILQDIQSRGALQDPRCGPLIGLMDQLGLTRCGYFLTAAFCWVHCNAWSAAAQNIHWNKLPALAAPPAAAIQLPPAPFDALQGGEPPARAAGGFPGAAFPHQCHAARPSAAASRGGWMDMSSVSGGGAIAVHHGPAP